MINSKEYDNLFVIKRNRNIIKFNISRITNAIRKSFESVTTSSPNMISDIDKVITHMNLNFDDKVISVEDIQDAVECSLMECGFSSVAKSYILYRQERFSLRSKSVVPAELKKLYNDSKTYFNDPLSEFVFYRSYSRWLPNGKRRETWPETVNRYIRYMEHNLGSMITREECIELEQGILNHEIMPSMRLLWSSGQANFRDHASGYNCTYTSISKLTDFAEIAYLSMCGAGCGYSVSRLQVSKLPMILHSTDHILEYTIQDSKEGWADAITFGCESWFHGHDVTFDYSLIRPAGSRLKIMGGKASGKNPLIELLLFLRNKIFNRRGSKLSTLDVHDIVCKIGEIVVSGGVRRTALISLSDLDDENIRDCKSGQFYLNHMHRSFSNNSAIYNKKPTSEEFLTEWLALLKSGSGERGIFNRGFVVQQAPERRKKRLQDNIDNVGVNPCHSPDTLVTTLRNGIPTDVFIKDVIPGDLVKSFDIEERHIVYKKVLDAGCTGRNVDIVKSTISLPNGDIVLSKHTPNHNFFNVKLWDYSKLCKNMVIITDKTWCYATTGYGYGDGIVNSMVPCGKSNVYNITVEDTHCYFANGLLSKNCGEITLLSKEMCNLSEVIARPYDTPESLKRKIRLATILGTYQATLTNFRYISPEWKQNAEDERLLGVSITGQWDCNIVRNASLLQELKDISIKINEEYAAKFGINTAAAISAIKPSGSVSILVNASSGMHARYAPYYIRRVRISATDSLFKMLKDQKFTYYPEVGQEIESCNTYVIEFPIKSPKGSVFQSDLSAIDQLEHWKMVKLNYTEHNPSVTIMIDDDDWISVANWVYSNWEIIGGLAFLPRTNHNYKLAPYEEISEEVYEQKLNDMPELDFSKLMLYETTDETSGSKEVACGGGSCDII